VGEHSPEVRARILAGMEWAGIVLDAARNRAARTGEARIDAVRGGPAIWVLPVDEAAIIAEKAWLVVRGAADPG
jgi:acetate kinase